MLSGRRVAVVVPAYEESARIGRVVATMPSFVDQVIVVDDASRDRTGEAAERAGDPRVRVLRHLENRGVGAAICSGYRAAREREGADVVAVMAGDGQMDPDDLPGLLAPLLEGRADYVKGNRLRHPRSGDMPLARRTGTRVLGELTGRVLGLPGLGDSQCGYTAITGELIDRLPLERVWPRYGYPNDLLARIVEAEGRVCEVSVRPVFAGESSGLRPWHVLVVLGLLARARGRLRASRVSRRSSSAR